MSSMKRRSFLLGLGAIGAAAAAGSGALLGYPRRALADGLPQEFQRKLVNLVLDGGPDFRHLIVPRPASDPDAYGYSYWKYRATSHYVNADDPTSWANRYDSDYGEITSIGGVALASPLGVLKKASWLKDRIAAGQVAIVANVKHSENRDHPHSLLMLQSGDLTTSSHATDRDGWGGRLADAVKGNVFSMTRQRRLFVNLPKGSKQRVVSSRDSRKFGLVRSKTEDWKEGSGPVSDRALRSYYQGARDSVDQGSPFAPFNNHELVLRGFSNAVQARLQSVPIPPALLALYSGDGRLLKVNPNFGEQVRSIYDCLACEDLLSNAGASFGFRVGSLDYGGWDSHKNQRDIIEPQFEELFGAGRAFDALYQEISSNMPSALPKLLFTVAGDFGRQLRSNGDRGTDHGRGNAVLLIGEGVRGGVYGELFPMEELAKTVDGKNKYEAFNQDITGKTSFSRVFGAAADWVAADDSIGDKIFPGRASSALESGVTLTRQSLFGTT